MCCCLSCTVLSTLLQLYKNNLKAVKAHCDEKFQSHYLNLLRWDSIDPTKRCLGNLFLMNVLTCVDFFSLGLSLMCGNKMRERAKKNDKRSLLRKLISSRLFFLRWDEQESPGQQSELANRNKGLSGRNMSLYLKVSFRKKKIKINSFGVFIKLQCFAIWRVFATEHAVKHWKQWNQVQEIQETLQKGEIYSVD